MVGGADSGRGGVGEMSEWASSCETIDTVVSRVELDRHDQGTSCKINSIMVSGADSGQDRVGEMSKCDSSCESSDTVVSRVEQDRPAQGNNCMTGSIMMDGVDGVDSVAKLEIQDNVEADDGSSGKASIIMVDGTEYWMNRQPGQMGGMIDSKSSSIMVGGADGELTSGSSIMMNVRMPVRDVRKTIGVVLDDMAKEGANGMVGGTSSSIMVGGADSELTSGSSMMMEVRMPVRDARMTIGNVGVDLGDMAREGADGEVAGTISSIAMGGADDEFTSSSSMMMEIRMPVSDARKAIEDVEVDVGDMVKEGADSMVGWTREQGMVGGGVRQECTESRVTEKELMRQLRGCVKIIKENGTWKKRNTVGTRGLITQRKRDLLDVKKRKYGKIVKRLTKVEIARI